MAAKVFQHLIIQHGSEVEVSLDEFKQALPTKEQLCLEQMLDKLEQVNILRKRTWQSRLWYEL